MIGADRSPTGHALTFIAGLHRSGTTPVARLLAAHPEISGFHDTGVKEDEGQHLQDVYPSAREYGGAGRFAFDERSHLTEDSPLVSKENAEALFDQWSSHWDLSRRVLVEKSPPNLVMTRFLQALYPDALFVVVMRHPIVVSLSTSQWRGGGRRLFPLIDHWLTAHEIFHEDQPHLTNVHVLPYERLMADPTGSLSDLATFLGLSSPISAESLDPSRSNTYIERWLQLAASTGWRQRRLVARIRDTYADRMDAFGYTLDDLQHCGVPA